MSDERTENKRRGHLRGRRKNMNFTLRGDLIAVIAERKRVKLLNPQSQMHVSTTTKHDLF